MKLILFIINLVITINLSSQDLTRQQPIEKIVYLKGKSGESHYFEPQEIIFTTGNLYKLTIKNLSDSKHYFPLILLAKLYSLEKYKLISININ